MTSARPHLDDLERGRLLADDGRLALVDRGRVLLGVHAVDAQTAGAVDAGREAVAVPVSMWVPSFAPAIGNVRSNKVPWIYCFFSFRFLCAWTAFIFVFVSIS